MTAPPSPPTAAALRALARRDPLLGAAMKRLEPYPGFPLSGVRRQPFYQALARSIVYQQLSGKAAGTIHGRVCALTPGKGFPTPPQVLELADDALRGAGLSWAKTAAVRDLAQRVESGRLKLRGLWRLGDQEVVEQLVKVRGIGVWTAQMFLMFRLGRLDLMPATDLGVLEGLRILDGLDARPDPKTALARAECWAPLRSVGAWFMWRLVEDERK